MIDFMTQLNAVEREVGNRTLDAGQARTVTVTQVYDTSVDDLWDACTNIERIPRWFLPISGELKVGGRYQLEGNAGGTVTRCEPPHGFDATWEFGGDVTWIEVRISEEPGGRARLRLEHIALVDEPRWAEYGPGAVGVGWDGAVLGLALHIQSGGDTVDRGEAEAAMATPEGMQFLRSSSEAWGEASIAAGEDATAAREAAARTTAAYTSGG